VPPRERADAVPEGSDIVACLGTQDALPTECTIPDRTVSGRVVGVRPVPIFQACIVALGAINKELGFAMADQNLRDDPFGWATDPNSPHPAVKICNNRAGIDVCLTTETGRDTRRGSCDPATVTATVTDSDTDSSSTGSALAATGGPSLLTGTRSCHAPGGRRHPGSIPLNRRSSRSVRLRRM
jgi:hypothetical protein